MPLHDYSPLIEFGVVFVLIVVAVLTAIWIYTNSKKPKPPEATQRCRVEPVPNWLLEELDLLARQRWDWQVVEPVASAEEATAGSVSILTPAMISTQAMVSEAYQEFFPQHQKQGTAMNPLDDEDEVDEGAYAHDD